jgi:predicted transcriptional regulator of viral defense system
MPPSRFYGQQELEVADTRVMVSDIERTLVDAVSIPGYCGGLTEAAKAFFMAKTRLNSSKLIEYAQRYNKWSVLRRIGYLLEIFELAPRSTLEGLAKTLPRGYSRLDPDLPRDGLPNSKLGVDLEHQLGRAAKRSESLICCPKERSQSWPTGITTSPNRFGTRTWPGRRSN